MIGSLFIISYPASFCSILSNLFDRVGNEALIAVGEGCCSLTHLNVSGCHLIGNAGIIAIARGCPQLSFLDVSVLQVPLLSYLDEDIIEVARVILVFVVVVELGRHGNG